jgi:predicted DNA-binding protein
MPSHPAEPSISLSLRLPLPDRERIIRLQRITGRTARDVVCEATRMMEEQLKLDGYLAEEDYDNRDLAKAIAEAAE